MKTPRSNSVHEGIKRRAVEQDQPTAEGETRAPDYSGHVVSPPKPQINALSGVTNNPQGLNSASCPYLSDDLHVQSALSLCRHPVRDPHMSREDMTGRDDAKTGVETCWLAL
jgi:hypothetical protein